MPEIVKGCWYRVRGTNMIGRAEKLGPKSVRLWVPPGATIEVNPKALRSPRNMAPIDPPVARVAVFLSCVVSVNLGSWWEEGEDVQKEVLAQLVNEHILAASLSHGFETGDAADKAANRAIFDLIDSAEIIDVEDA